MARSPYQLPKWARLMKALGAEGCAPQSQEKLHIPSLAALLLLLLTQSINPEHWVLVKAATVLSSLTIFKEFVSIIF